jgi:ribonuclease J
VSHPHPNLGAPPPLAAGALRVVALGGLGEVGRNMTIFEHDGRLLVVDCGVLFPEEHQQGVDVILPDFSWIQDRLHDVVAIVLTHGHEDHIGAVPYLLRDRADIPVVGSTLTLAFLTAQLREHRMEPSSVVVAAGDRRSFGPFDLEFAAVNHSIPDGPAVAIRTAAGLLVHTGDFKMDQFRWTGGSPTCAPLRDGLRSPSTCCSSTRRTRRCRGSRCPSGRWHRPSTPSSVPPLDG